MRVARADGLILDLVETTLLYPAVLEVAATKTIERLSGRGRQAESKRTELVAALTAVDAELLRLTSALAAGGDFNAIVEAIAARETKKAGLLLDLRTLGQEHIEFRLDPSFVKARIAEALTEWQTTIRRHIPQARSMLTKLLRGGLTVTPEERDGVSGFRLRGEGSVQRALAGWLPDFPKGAASPTGLGGNGLTARPVAGPLQRAA